MSLHRKIEREKKPMFFVEFRDVRTCSVVRFQSQLGYEVLSSVVKFRFSEKAQKFGTIFLLNFTILSKGKSPGVLFHRISYYTAN